MKTGWLRAAWEHPGLRLPWGAVWRAQALHLAFFVVPPLLIWLGKALIAGVFPLLVIVGPGDSSVHIAKGTEHLHEPGCWIALAPCPYAEARVPGLPALHESYENRVFKGREGPLAAWPDALNWRHVWFIGWLAWFLFFVADRERTRPDTP